MIVTEFQPLLWLVRDSSFVDTSIIQPEDGWLDTAGFRNLHLRTHILYVSGTQSLYTETCDVRDGSWEYMSTFTSASASATPSDDFYTADRPKSEYQRMRRYVRWRWTGFTGGGPFEMCFRMMATVKK